MKKLTIAFAGTALLALGACNGQQTAEGTDGNNVSGTIDNAGANAAAPVTNAADGAKPTDGAAPAPATAPTGDKPTDGAAAPATEPPAGDKPTG